MKAGFAEPHIHAQNPEAVTGVVIVPARTTVVLRSPLQESQ